MLKKISLGLILLATPSLAVEYQSPRTLGLGGAGRGGPLLNDSIYLNPSYASFTPTYSLTGGYLWFDKGRNYNLSVEDSRTEMFQAGMGYTKREQNSTLNLGASKTLISNLGIGVGAKYVIDNDTGSKTMNFSLSSSYIATPWAYVSVVVDNVLESADTQARNLYRTVYLGTKFLPLDKVTLYVDPLYSPNYKLGPKAGVAAGAEITVMSDFLLRLGRFQHGEISHLNTRGIGNGIGLGYLGPKVRFDYSFTRINSADGGYGLSTSNSLETTVFF